MTPEGKVKAEVKKILANYGDDLDQFWPVQNGMGSPALDCIVCYKGRYAAIETKAGNKFMTPRQTITATKLQKAGATVFVINEVSGMNELLSWLEYTRCQ